jgi:TonB-dependent Receptor Plug Domain
MCKYVDSPMLVIVRFTLLFQFLSVPGLTVINSGGEPGNDNAQLYVRGLNTIGNNSPLIIVDGIPSRSLE